MIILHVDAFTGKAGSGNQAAVCLLDKERTVEWMQSLAADMNLSETAFTLKSGEGYSLRWFTPECEVSLCGHATLASAHALWEEGVVNKEEQITFTTLSGELKCIKNGNIIEMDFPVSSLEDLCGDKELKKIVEEALGTGCTEVWRAGEDILFLLSEEEEVRKIKPDIRKLKQVEARGFIVTARASPKAAAYGADFVSRFFAPAIGIDEDPVTGSAHLVLGPFWGKRLGKSSLKGVQLSKRGGEVYVKLKHARVLIGGRAVTITRGRVVI